MKNRGCVGTSEENKTLCLLTKRVANSPIYRKKTNALFSNAIAITGGIATGKSTACNILRLYGYSIIDMDKISHEVLEESVGEVVGVFGSEILMDSAKNAESAMDCAKNVESAMDSAKKINRKKLGAIVFNDKAKLATLEAILHPKIRAEVAKKAQHLEAQNITYFIDIPIFFELKVRGEGYEIPRTLLIYAPRESQLARMQKRDNISADEAQMRLSNQIDIEQKRQMADFVIENVGSVRELQERIEAFLREIQ